MCDHFMADIDEINECTAKLYVLSDREEWLNNYRERSRVIRKAYAHIESSNNQLETALNALDGLHYEQAEAFYSSFVKNFDVSRYDDPFYAVRILEMLTAFYSKTNDLLRLIPLLSRLGYEYSVTVRMQYEENFDKAFNCYKAVLSYKDKYNLIPDISVRRIFFVAYYNISCVLVSLSPVVNADVSARYFKEMMDFFESDMVQKIDGKNKVITEFVKFTKIKWLSIENIIDYASPETKKLFIRIAKETYESDLREHNGDIYKLNVEVLLAFHHSLILEGKRTYLDAANYILEYYFTRKQLPRVSQQSSGEVLIDDNFYFETRLPDALIHQWLNNSDIPEEMRRADRRRLIDSKNAYFEEITRNITYTPFINSSLCEWCFSTIKYLSNIDEKEKALTNMIVNRQIFTFFHSHMVAELAIMITEAIFRNDPSLLCGLLNIESEDEIIEEKDRILQYINKAALFHDVGKNLITDIINTQFRKLTPEEYQVIKKHPELGAFNVDEDFDIYRDIMLGHHRTYDMTGGYPLCFDPDESNVKIICDIIAICDSLDAGTDYLGRNYTRKKDFAMVLSELILGSGTKYNPDIITLLSSDETLHMAIDDLFTNRRENLYYDWFRMYFNKYTEK